MWDKAMWIGVPREEIREKQIYQGEMNGRFAYFVNSFSLEEAGELVIHISAASRYRLWANGVGVQSGPCRGDNFRQYYETIDVSPWLKIGENRLAVQVLCADRAYVANQMGEDAPLVSIASPSSQHRLAVEGVVKVRGAAGPVVTTGAAEWRVYLESAWKLEKQKGVSDNLGASVERIDFARALSGWREPGFDCGGWREAAVIEPVSDAGLFRAKVGFYTDFHMVERPIPLLMEREEDLCRLVDGAEMPESIRLAPGERRVLCFGTEYVRNGFPRFRFQSGKGGKAAFTYFERFVSREGEDGLRDDWEKGEIGGNGLRDEIALPGGELVYEPFWVRTFRFLQIELEAGEEELVFFRPGYHRTGYPLEAKSWVESSAEWVGKLYDMCLHTLESCMMETYMDCPFWEQMQYPMDTRLQALFTYVCSTDTRLAAKALEDFHCSKVPLGLIQGRAPSGYRQVISTFSLHYIFMLWEYYLRTGETAVLKRYRGDVDEILNYYEDRLDPETGLVGKPDFWAFVDWQRDWMENAGVPAALKTGPSALISLMVGRGLLVGADIVEATGRPALAEEYRARQRALCARVRALCWDEGRGMYREGPEFAQFTQHTQSWAVLNGMEKGEKARALLRRALTEEDVLACSFSTCYELFRACEEAGCYGLVKGQLDTWIGLIGQHCGTCPETPADSRSNCHAWSALPMYELLAVMAGIRRQGDGFLIAPRLDLVPDLRGELETEWGMLGFSYQRGEKGWEYRVRLPKGCKAVLARAGREPLALDEGENAGVLD